MIFITIFVYQTQWEPSQSGLSRTSLASIHGEGECNVNKRGFKFEIVKVCICLSNPIGCLSMLSHGRNIYKFFTLGTIASCLEFTSTIEDHRSSIHRDKRCQILTCPSTYFGYKLNLHSKVLQKDSVSPFCLFLQKEIICGPI